MLFARIAGLLKLRGGVFTILLGVVLLCGLSGQHIIHGDGREYILQTQAIVFDGTLKIDTDARRDYWNESNPYGIELGDVRPPAKHLTEATQAGGGFGGLYPDRFGQYRYYHFWTYSAVVAPVYVLFHHIDRSGSLEYFSFRFVNVCLLLVFFLMAFREGPHWPTIVILALLLFSPLIPYCDWQHPELFCMTFVFGAFLLATRQQGALAAPLVLGLAASMSPPILLFFPALIVSTMRSTDVGRVRAFWKLAACYVSGGLIALSASAYYFYYFGTPNVIAHIGLASLHNASVSRSLDVFVSPFVGVLFFFPMALLLLPASVTRKSWIEVVSVTVCVFLATWLCTATSNLNAGQVGTVRYATWLLAPIWYVLFRHIPTRYSLSLRGWTLSIATGLSVLAVVSLKTYRLLDKDIRRFGGAWRAQPEVATLVRILPFESDAEIVVENILGKELARPSMFRDVYMWDLRHDKYLWVFPERSLEQHRPVIFWTSEPDEILFRAIPTQEVDWTVKGNLVTVRLADTLPRMKIHPVLGRYLTLRSKGRITRILKNHSFRIRSDHVEQVDALDEE
jgi:hypothetical protein